MSGFAALFTVTLYVVATDPHRPITLQDWNNRCGSIQELHWLDDVGAFQWLKLLVYLGPQDVWCSSGLVEPGLCCIIHMDFSGHNLY